MGNQALPQRIAVKVEGDRPVRDEDVVSGKADARNDALAMESGKRRTTQKSARQDMAGAEAEKDSVREGQRRSDRA